MKGNGDWLSRLTPAERHEWNEFVRHVREETVRGMASNAMVMSLMPRGEPDIKFSLELGLAILMEKPIIVIAYPGQKIPARLRRVADAVILADVDTEAGQKRLAKELPAVMARLK